MGDIKFDEKVDYIYNSINKSFNIERMLLNNVEVDEFKSAIQRGLDDYFDSQDILMTQEIVLTDEQFEKVKSVLETEYTLEADGCDCGDWIVHLEGLGYFTLSNSCRKSSCCPSGMQWFVHTEAYIYDKNVAEECYDWENIKSLYEVDKRQVAKLRDIANNTLINQKGYDEYGEDLIYKNINS